MGYTQVQVDGELLVLRVDTALFQYHARGGGAVRVLREPERRTTASAAERPGR